MDSFLDTSSSIIHLIKYLCATSFSVKLDRVLVFIGYCKNNHGWYRLQQVALRGEMYIN